MMTDDTQGALM